MGKKNRAKQVARIHKREGSTLSRRRTTAKEEKILRQRYGMSGVPVPVSKTAKRAKKKK